MHDKRSEKQEFFLQKNRKGQLAIFVIAALVLLFALGFYYLVSQEKIQITGKEKIDSFSEPIYNYIKECIETSIFDSLESFGLQQGFYSVPEGKSLDTGFSRIAYYYLEGEILIPQNDFFEKELSKIINDKISEQCEDFSIFEDDGYEINFKNPSSETKISENEIKAYVNYPLSVKTDEDSASFSEFSYEIPVRTGHIIDVSKILVEKIKDEPYNVDLTFLLNQDVGVSVDEHDECNQIYILVDEQSKINEEPFAFSFAIKLEKQYCSGESV